MVYPYYPAVYVLFSSLLIFHWCACAQFLITPPSAYITSLPIIPSFFSFLFMFLQTMHFLNFLRLFQFTFDRLIKYVRGYKYTIIRWRAGKQEQTELPDCDINLKWEQHTAWPGTLATHGSWGNWLHTAKSESPTDLCKNQNLWLVGEPDDTQPGLYHRVSMLVTVSSVASKQTNKLSFVFGGTVGSSATVVSAGTLSKHFLKNFPQTLSAKTFSQNVYGF